MGLEDHDIVIIMKIVRAPAAGEAGITGENLAQAIPGALVITVREVNGKLEEETELLINGPLQDLGEGVHVYSILADRMVPRGECSGVLVKWCAGRGIFWSVLEMDPLFMEKHIGYNGGGGKQTKNNARGCQKLMVYFGRPLRQK